jgi:hypothetical protein
VRQALLSKENTSSVANINWKNLAVVNIPCY